jgi:hypothetical protein
MSDINFSINGQVSKGALSQGFAATGITADIATAGVLQVTLALATATQQVTTTSLGALGLAFVRNLSTVTTHEVSLGRLVTGTLHETVRLKGNEAAVLRLAAGNYAMKGSTSNATTRATLTIFED